MNSTTEVFTKALRGYPAACWGELAEIRRRRIGMLSVWIMVGIDLTSGTSPDATEKAM